MPSEETYDRRIERELKYLRALLKRNWLIGLLIIFAGAAYAGIRIAPEKKPSSDDLTAKVLKQAHTYQLLVEEHKRLLETSQKMALGAAFFSSRAVEERCCRTNARAGCSVVLALL